MRIPARDKIGASASVELLAMALYTDRFPGREWFSAEHPARELFRDMAAGVEPISGDVIEQKLQALARRLQDL
jgi:hypothetical protein